MPSSGYSCVNSADMTALSKAIDVYKTLSDKSVVVEAATTAGQHLKTAMQKTIRTFTKFPDVAAGLQVWSDSSNVYVGIPPGDGLLPRALEMDKGFPLAETVTDLTRQMGDTQDAFFEALAGYAQ